VAFARVRRDGRVLLVRRPKGLLRGMWSLPTLAREGDSSPSVFEGLSLQDAGLVAGRVTRAGEIRHVFTHRDVTAEVFDVATRPAASAGKPPPGEQVWANGESLGDLATSSFLRKLLAVGGVPSVGGRTKRDKRRKTP